MLLGALIVSAFVISSCGSSTPNSHKPLNDHLEPGWLPAGHMEAALADQESCTECHGSDYSGGIAGVSCSKCHLGGVDSVHPVEWGTHALIFHQTYALANGTSSCANEYCHGTQLQGVDGSGPSCTVCH